MQQDDEGSTTVRPMERGEQVACEAIFRALPEWFGIEESIVDYVHALETLETWVAEEDAAVVGFLVIRQHSRWAAEIEVMAVAPARHGRGFGRRLVESAERALRARSVEFLQVKTLSPARPDIAYDRTRGFYERMGFRPLEETNAWGDGNPCLVMVKHLPSSTRRDEVPT